MAYGNLNKSTKEINALLDKIKDTDQTLDKASQNPVSNAAVTAGLSKKVDEMPGWQLSEENYTTKEKELLASLNTQMGDVSTLLDTLNGEVV